MSSVKKYEPDEMVRRIVSETARPPLIPDRRFDRDTGTYFGEQDHALERSLEKGFLISGDVNGKLARVCRKPDISWLRRFLGDAEKDAKKLQVLVYCPAAHAGSTLDPFAVAREQGFYPFKEKADDDAKKKFENLVNGMLTTGQHGSSVVTYKGQSEAKSEEFVNLQVGDWIMINYEDETNKIDGTFISLYKKASEMDTLVATTGPTSARRSFGAGSPTPMTGRSRTPQLSSGAATLDDTPPPPPEDVDWLIGSPVTEIIPYHDRRSRGLHQGLDVFAREGSQVFAVEGGIVEGRTSINGYGLTVIIYSSEKDKQFLYAHLSSMSVSPGQSVNAGDLIGHVGSTAHYRPGHPSYRGDGTFFASDLPHLHFEVLNGRGRINRAASDRREDPWTWLQHNEKKASSSGNPQPRPRRG